MVQRIEDKNSIERSDSTILVILDNLAHFRHSFIVLSSPESDYEDLLAGLSRAAGFK